MAENTKSFVGKITQKAVLFNTDGEVLVTEVGDYWEIPGGTFEFGETLVGGLRRELPEELDLATRVGPPVEAIYGAWADGETGNPMVTLVYRCETDDTTITLNEEHDDYEWVSPARAAERLEDAFGQAFGIRLARAVKRAATFDDEDPFGAVVEPYADDEVTTVVLEHLAAARASDEPPKGGE